MVRCVVASGGFIVASFIFRASRVRVPVPLLTVAGATLAGIYAWGRYRMT